MMVMMAVMVGFASTWLNTERLCIGWGKVDDGNGWMDDAEVILINEGREYKGKLHTCIRERLAL